VTQITSRPFRDQADLLRMRDFLSAANAASDWPGFWHIGDLIWGVYQNTVFDPQRSIRLWESADGELLGFGWLEEPDGVNLQIHPRLRGDGTLEQQILAWAAEHNRARLGVESPELWAKANDSDAPLCALLERLGFARDDFHYLLMRRDLQAPIPDTALPAGWSVRHVGGEDEWPARVETHREVWHPSKVTLEAYRRLRQAPVYDPELDLVAVSPDGEFASYCICWLDPANRCGEFEPVGTRSAFRGRRIGTAVMLEGLRRLRERGAESAIVVSVGSNEASRRLYESVGFRTFDREYLYGKTL
jgi:ribosomal protein S18 acetylase RimI-like enzyme